MRRWRKKRVPKPHEETPEETMARLQREADAADARRRAEFSSGTWALAPGRVVQIDTSAITAGAITSDKIVSGSIFTQRLFPDS